jgi:ABC-type amino acid transport substrate-binding protein
MILCFGFAEYRKSGNFTGLLKMIATEVGEKLKGLKPRWETVPGWKRKLLYVAAGLGLFGLGSDGYEALKTETAATPARQAAAPARSSESGSLRSSLAQPSDRKTADVAEAETNSPFQWGGATGRLGLSFSLAFLSSTCGAPAQRCRAPGWRCTAAHAPGARSRLPARRSS